MDNPFTILEDETIQSYIDLVKKPDEAAAEEGAADGGAAEPAASDAQAEAMETEG